MYKYLESFNQFDVQVSVEVARCSAWPSGGEPRVRGSHPAPSPQSCNNRRSGPTRPSKPSGRGLLRNSPGSPTRARLGVLNFAPFSFLSPLLWGGKWGALERRSRYAGRPRSAAAFPKTFKLTRNIYFSKNLSIKTTNNN